MRMRSLALVAAVAFFLVSPGFACGPADPEWKYGATELRMAIEGDWAVTITPTGGAPVEVMMHLQQSTQAPATAALERPRSLVRSAHACGSRTLVASASACGVATHMPLDVTLAPGSAATNGAPSGSFNVYSLIFSEGNLDLVIGGFAIGAVVNADGTVKSAALSPPTAGTATLRRL
jgi:hypothetical protein